MKTNIKKRLSFAVFFLVLLITVLFSVGKTLQYYFYVDDYSVLYHTQHNIPHGWPYHNYILVFSPVYRFFGLRAEAFLTLGILTFFFASLGVYFFIKILTKNNLIAMLSSLIFATGHIGVDQFTMAMVSSINNLSIINVSLTLILFILWLDTRKWRFYLLTMLMFWFSLKAFPGRAFPLVLFLPTIEVILSFKLEHPVKICKKFFLMVVRFLPFLLIAYRLGILSYGTKGGQLYAHSKILALFTLASIKELFALLGRFVLLKPLIKVFGFSPPRVPYSRVGFTFFSEVILIALVFSFIKKYSRLGRSLLIVLFLTIEGYIGFLLLLGFVAISQVNRYLTIAFLGYSAIFPILIYLLVGKLSDFVKRERLKWLVPVLASPLIIIMALLSREYEQEIVQDRSLPTRQFFRQLKNYLPSISSKNIFYFDHADYYPVASRFGSILLGAGMPKEATLAVQYQVPLESVEIIDDFDALVAALKNNEVNIDNVHTFYYNQTGLHQTTNKVLSFLEKGDKKEIPISQVNYGSEITSPRIEIPLTNISSLTPMVVNLNLKLTALSSSFFSFPFYGLKTQDENKKEQIKEFYEKEITDKSLIFDYLLSRKRYYDNVKVEVVSSHPSYPGKFLVDDKVETWWLAEESDWQVSIKPRIKIDLGEARKISKLVWHQLKDRVPSDYQISVSCDEVSWKEVESMTTYESLTQIFQKKTIENFAPVRARFIMFEINKTMNGWTPGFSEIEVVEDKYNNVDIPLAFRTKENPFEYIRDEEDLQETYHYLHQNSILKLSTLTDKDGSILNNYALRVPLELDGDYHDYQVPLSPRGTRLKKIRLELNFPAKIEVGKIEIIHLSLKEIGR